MNLENKIIVAKTGGSSNADGNMVTRVKKIMDADQDRRILVVSAPGKSGKFDRKITEMLYTLYFHALFEQTSVSWDTPKEHRPDAGTDYTPQNDLSPDEITERILAQYHEISSTFSLIDTHVPNLKRELDMLTAIVGNEREYSSKTRDMFAMQGEISFAPMMAEILGAKLLDPLKLIHYDNVSARNATTYGWIKERLQMEDGKRYVMAGFAANQSTTDIVPICLPRGGSDLTGALIAAGIKKAGYENVLYENWTDSPIFRFNPLDFDKLERSGLPAIRQLSFAEAEELTGSGFGILEASTTGAAREAGVPIHVRVTKDYSDQGTLISDKTDDVIVAGVSGISPIYAVKVFKHGMSGLPGVMAHVSGILNSLLISYEHNHTGNNYFQVGIRDWQLTGKRDALMRGLNEKPELIDRVEISENNAYINIVGNGLINNLDVSERIFGAMRRAKINTPAYGRADPGMNIVLLVSQKDYRTAIHALRNEFYPPSIPAGK